VIRYTDGFTFEQFVADEKTLDAVLRNLAIIGEAVKQLPQDVRELCPEVEWRKIARFRDVVIHRYFSVDEQIVWDIVANEVPALLEQLGKMPEPPATEPSEPNP
jgi:uncharacterized protein with HEPN domain